MEYTRELTVPYSFFPKLGHLLQSLLAVFMQTAGMITWGKFCRNNCFQWRYQIFHTGILDYVLYSNIIQISKYKQIFVYFINLPFINVCFLSFLERLCSLLFVRFCLKILIQRRSHHEYLYFLSAVVHAKFEIMIKRNASKMPVPKKRGYLQFQQHMASGWW